MKHIKNLAHILFFFLINQTVFLFSTEPNLDLLKPNLDLLKPNWDLLNAIGRSDLKFVRSYIQTHKMTQSDMGRHDKYGLTLINWATLCAEQRSNDLKEDRTFINEIYYWFTDDDIYEEVSTTKAIYPSNSQILVIQPKNSVIKKYKFLEFKDRNFFLWFETKEIISIYTFHGDDQIGLESDLLTNRISISDKLQKNQLVLAIINKNFITGNENTFNLEKNTGYFVCIPDAINTTIYLYNHP